MQTIEFSRHYIGESFSNFVIEDGERVAQMVIAKTNSHPGMR